mgnify:CR=1 FL=1
MLATLCVAPGALQAQTMVPKLDAPGHKGDLARAEKKRAEERFDVFDTNKDGDVFWNLQLVADNNVLVERLKKVSVLEPQPEVHIRGDQESRYESVGRVVFACQRAGILKISFVTEPPAKS